MLGQNLINKVLRRRNPVIMVERKRDDREGLIGNVKLTVWVTMPMGMIQRTGLILGYACDTSDDDHSWFFLQYDGSRETGWHSEFEVVIATAIN